MGQTQFENGAAKPVTGFDQLARNHALACRGQPLRPPLAEQQRWADTGAR